MREIQECEQLKREEKEVQVRRELADKMTQEISTAAEARNRLDIEMNEKLIKATEASLSSFSQGHSSDIVNALKCLTGMDLNYCS